MKRRYGLQQIQKHFFKIQIFVFCGLSLAIGLSLYEPKPIENLTQQLLMRGPASVSTSEPTKSTETLKVLCQENSKIAANSHHIRIESEFCEKKFDSLKIKNKTTGSQAIFFKRSPASFTTDYIQLNPGENEISFVYKTGKIETEKTIQILKNSPQ